LRDVASRPSATSEPCERYQRLLSVAGSSVRPRSVEIPRRRGEGRKIAGRQAPLATGLGDIEDGTHEPPHAGLTPLSGSWRWRHRRLDDCLFGIRYVTCLTQSVAPILATRDLGPGDDEYALSLQIRDNRSRHDHATCISNQSTSLTRPLGSRSGSVAQIGGTGQCRQ